MTKALTIYQPWAQLIIEGAKPFEFRGWRAHQAIIGQEIVIHAAARVMVAREVEEIIANLQAGGQRAAMTCLVPDKALPILQRMLRELAAGAVTYSAGLGTVTLGEPVNGLVVAKQLGVEFANDSDRADHANWGWPMLNVNRWIEPIPMRGAQGFWTCPEPESAGL